MRPIVTPEEMRVIDAWAPEPQDVLIERAGAAVARAARGLLGGTYGRTVVVVVGKGNNGADGRVAARRLAARGVHVRVVEAANAAATDVGDADLVIDAAYGTGFRGVWQPPDVGATRVLAVDVPSGVDALTGGAAGPVLTATRTVTFAALKPGLLIPPGRDLAGDVELVDIGLDVSSARAQLIDAEDVRGWWPTRRSDSHKWRQAVRVVAGSPTMTGAALLASRAAARAGAGMVALSVPGQLVDGAPLELVQRSIPRVAWTPAALDGLDRFGAVVVGPGLGREDGTAAEVRRFVVEADIPMVVDGDALFALAWSATGAAPLLRDRRAPTVVTPHDGEYKLLTGEAPAGDRLVAARRLASDAGCVVLLKGPATVVADPQGRTLVADAGDRRLATAGTGDVLAGIVGALLAAGVEALHAAAAGAWIHGRAARHGHRAGFVAGDLPDLLPDALAELGL